MTTTELYCPRPGYATFRVRVFNREVRAALKENRQHTLVSECWADDRLTVVEARDAGEAHDIATLRYPPDSGFVICGVESIARR